MFVKEIKTYGRRIQLKKDTGADALGISLGETSRVSAFVFGDCILLFRQKLGTLRGLNELEETIDLIKQEINIRKRTIAKEL